MRIRELLAVESIDLNAKAASKKEALDHAVDLMARSGKIGDVETYRKGVYAREEEGHQPVLVKGLRFLTANQML